MLQHLSLTKRRILAALLAAAGLAYAVLLATTYLQTTAPSALGPDLADLNQILFPAARPISPMQRRLEAADTPLGAGPLITGRPLDQYSELNSADLAEREAERQALLDWIRSGASRTAYERDDYVAAESMPVALIMPELLTRHASAAHSSGAPHVRIRTLINERCLSCHNEDGDDTARLIPFDSYEAIARYLVPDDHTSRVRAWLFAALICLFPLAGSAGCAFFFTDYELASRRRVLAVTIAALMILSASWILGSFFAPLLLIAALVAMSSVTVQILATVIELLGIRWEQESLSESVLHHGHT